MVTSKHTFQRWGP